MKLARLALLLLVANLLFLAWSQGWLAGVTGWRAHSDREPERAARQFQPHLLRIVPARAPAASAPAAGALACLEAGPFAPADAQAAEALLQAALPAGSWTRRSVEQPGVWMVYLGRYLAADQLQRRVEELRRLQIPFDEVASPPDLAPGLSLGRFDSRAAADEALDAFAQRGVRTARVVLFSEPATRVALRVERADAALAAQLQGLAGSVAGQPLARAFRPCAG